MTANPTEALADAASRYANWFRNEALPFWATAGRDVRHGGSIERVEIDGSVDPTVPLRIRVQARQLFVYASAAERGWYDSAGFVEGLWTFMETWGGCPERPGYGHKLVWPDGPRDDRLDLYDQAFYLLATALHHRVTGADASRQRAHETLALIDERLTAPNGGWFEGDYGARLRRQNPHMHLFEAFMAWHETDGDERWLVRAGEIYALFRQHFFDVDYGVIREFFTDAWGRPTDPADDTAEPGHLLEWVWLLDWYQRLTGTSTDGAQQQLFETAITRGADGDLMVETLNHDATVRDRGKRLWPMTEYIKASCVRAAAGDDRGLDHAVRAINGLFAGFVAPASVAPYVDRLDAANAVSDARSPASSLYHLAAAEIELERLLGAV